MKVSKVGSTKDISSTSKKKKASGSGTAFAQALQEGQASGTSSVHEVQNVGNVDAVFAVQEVTDSLDGRSRGLLCQYGEDVLEDLDDLRIGLIEGAVSKDRLTSLARKLREKRQQSDDVELNSIIDEIELRAEVEVAKLTRKL